MLLLTVFVTLSFNKFTRKEKKIQELKTFRDLELDLEGGKKSNCYLGKAIKKN